MRCLRFGLLQEEELPPASMLRVLRTNSAEWKSIVGGCVAAFIGGTTVPIIALLFAEVLMVCVHDFAFIAMIVKLRMRCSSGAL